MTFVPNKPEEKINVTITVREAVLLSKLRYVHFGQVMIHKANGLITRIEPTNSIRVEPNKDDIDLE